MRTAVGLCLVPLLAMAATDSGGRPTFRAGLPDGRTLVVQRDRIPNAASPEWIRQATTRLGGSGKIEVPDSVFRFTFSVADPKTGAQESVWSLVAPDDRLTPGGIDVLDASFEARTLVVVYRLGKTIQGEVLECPVGAAPTRRVHDAAIYEEGWAGVRAAKIGKATPDGPLSIRLRAVGEDGEHLLEFHAKDTGAGLHWVATNGPTSRPLRPAGGQ